MGNIFISYAREDKRIALEIYQALKSRGFSAWIDEKNLLPGQDWKAEIEKAIHDSDIFIACISSHSVKKRGFVQAEQRRALEVAELMPLGEIFIIPVRLDNCEIPSKLSQYQWLDYFEPDSHEKLLKAIRGQVGNSENRFLEYEQVFDAGERIKTVREELGIRTSQIIELLGVPSQREYEAMEAREKEIPERLLRGISELSGVNLEWLKHAEEPRYEVDKLSLISVDRCLAFCASLKPLEYIVIFEKKSYDIELIAKVSEFRYQIIDMGMHLDFWKWEDDYWAIPAFYKFLKRLSDGWLGIISTVFLSSKDHEKLLRGDIHYLVAARNGNWRRVGFLEDLLDLEQTRNGSDWYSRIYGGNWMERVHSTFKERLAEDAIRTARKPNWLDQYAAHSGITVSFQDPVRLPSQTLKMVWLFPFTAVDTSLKNTPEELGRTDRYEVLVSASVQLVASWNLFHPLSLNNPDEIERVDRENHQLMKILFWYGKRFITEKISGGNLQKQEEVYLDTKTPHILEPLDVMKIPEPSGFTFEV